MSVFRSGKGEAKLLAGSGLGCEVDVRAVNDCDDGVSAGDGVVGQEDHGLSGRRNLYRSEWNCFGGQFIEPRALEYTFLRCDRAARLLGSTGSRPSTTLLSRIAGRRTSPRAGPASRAE